MSVVKVTTHPMKYLLMELIEDILPDEVYAEVIPPEEKLYIQFELASAAPQRQIAQVLGEAYGEKPVHLRDREWKSIYNKGYYEVAGWTVNGNVVTSNRFSLAGLPYILNGLDAMNKKGYMPDGEIRINLVSDALDLRQVLNLQVMLEARKTLLEQALGLSDNSNNELKIILDTSLALSLPLGVFDLPKIEAAACLLYQMSTQTEQTGKVRMKPADGSNPRYQMRTWLLRLGFIGEQFARPRQTLLENLEGNSAFFNPNKVSPPTAERRTSA